MIKKIKNQNGLNGKSEHKKVNLEWWAVEVNLGDAISPIIVDWVLNKKGINRNGIISKTTHLMAVGSLLGMRRFDATVWGSGVLSLGMVMRVNSQSRYRKYDVRAVRGPLTQQVIKFAGYSCPDIFGDPAILMPDIYVSVCKEKRYKVSIVSHHEFKIPQSMETLCNIIDIKTKDYMGFIDSLNMSEKVVSSSLHGIILAEAYGIPAIFLGTGMESQYIKFYDWYYSTGRYSVKVAKTIEEALVMEPMPLPELEQMRKNILAAFPYDLWE